MNKNATLWTIVGVIVVVLAAWWIYGQVAPATNVPTPPTSTTGTTPSSTAPVFDKSVTDGVVSLQYPSADFGVATNGQAILLNSVIPACDSDFDNCIYYNNTSTYAGTNFESAGLRIEKRPDLANQAQCLDINPSGYNSLSPVIATSTGYAVSLFGNIGSGAAGNLATDNIYRLAYNGSCYEFDLRVAQTDFANYPPGSVQQFTSSDQAAVQSELQSILNTVTFSDGKAVIFPQI